MKQSRRHIDINLNELDQVLDHARTEPLSESDCEKLRMALHTRRQAAAFSLKQESELSSSAGYILELTLNGRLETCALQTCICDSKHRRRPQLTREN